jgi:hypothetical protein
MKAKILLSALFLIIGFAHAKTLEKICQKTIVADQYRNGVFYKYPPKFFKDANTLLAVEMTRDQEKLVYSVEKFTNDNHETLYQTSERINGITKSQNSYWLLKDYSVIEMAPNGKILGDYTFSSHLATSKAFSSDDQFLYIAQANEGVIAFDTYNKRVSWKTNVSEVYRNSHRSIPVSTSVYKDKVYVVMTGMSENGFNGVAIIEASTGKFVTAAEYDKRRSGVIDPQAKSLFFNDNLVINNGGWIHVLNKATIQNSRTVRPKWISVRNDDPQYPHYMMIEGEFFFDQEEKLNACGLYQVVNQDGRLDRKAQLYRVALPL